MRIDAIVLHWGTPATTARAVAALRTSSRAPDRILVVDNGSPPGLAPRDEVACARLTLPRNLGFSGGCNAGIADALAAGADAVLLVNSDAVLAGDALGRLERLLAATPDAGAVAPALERGDGKLESVGVAVDARSGHIRLIDHGAARPSRAEPHAVRAVAATVVLLRATALRAAGLFDEAYFFSYEDVELCLRLGAAGWRVLVDPRARARHLGHASIGAGSPRRHYFAARNHLRLGAALPAGNAVARTLRQLAIAGAHLADAGLHAGAPGVAAAWRGISDHLRRRYGPDPAAPASRPRAP